MGNNYIKLFEDFKLYDRIPEDAKIIVSEGNFISIYLVDKNYKFISAIGLGELDNDFYVGGVASERGFGPLIYEFAMMRAYPNGLMPSRDGDIRGSAWSVWERFYDRIDVKKETLELGDDDYTFAIYGEDDFLDSDEKTEYLNNLLDDKNNTDPIRTLNIFNSLYHMEPNEEYLSRLVDLKDLPKNVISYIKKQDEEFFVEKYD